MRRKITKRITQHNYTLSITRTKHSDRKVMCALNNKTPKCFEHYWEGQECSESWEVFCLRKRWWHLQCTAQSMIHHDAADIGSTLRSQLWRHRSPTKSRHKLRPCMHACMCCHRLLLRSLGSNVNGERARAGGKKTAVCFLRIEKNMGSQTFILRRHCWVCRPPWRLQQVVRHGTT